MEICSALLGERIALLEADEFEGKSLKAVKQFLAAKVGVLRFRQRLLSGDGSEISDDEFFDLVPVKVHLLLLELWSPDAEHNQKMIAACRDNDPAALEELLQRPQEPNVTDEHGRAPLHFAAAGGHLTPAKLLLAARAEIDSRQEADGMTPLHLGSFGGHLDVVQLLLEAGADKDISKNDGCTALGLAADRGHLDVMRLLLEAGAEKDISTHLGITALGVAASAGQLDVVRLLLEAGADKEKTSTGGLTALGLAVSHGHLDTVRLLSEAGADTEKTSYAGLTALGLAVSLGHLDTVRLLLEAGAHAETSLKGAFSGLSVLGIAALKGNLDIVRLLVEAGADKEKIRNNLELREKEMTQKNQTVALLLAAAHGHLDIVRLLLEAGADGPKTLAVAIERCSPDVVRLLREAGAEKDMASDRWFQYYRLAGWKGACWCRISKCHRLLLMHLSLTMGKSLVFFQRQSSWRWCIIARKEHCERQRWISCIRSPASVCHLILPSLFCRFLQYINYKLIWSVHSTRGQPYLDRCICRACACRGTI